MFTDELPNWQSVELLRNSFELSQQAMNSSKVQLPRVGLGVMESNLEMLSERPAMSGLARYGVQQRW